MHRFKNILYFADGSAETCPALQRAVDLAKSNDARLTVIDVIAATDSPAAVERQFGMDVNRILREHREQALASMVAPYNETETMIYTRVESGAPFVEVIRAILRNGHDLLIKAARAPAGYAERVLGSTDMHLLRKCPCPVWIDQSTAAGSYQTVLAAVDPVTGDGEGCDQLIMELATSVSQRESARLAVVHAWRLYGESMLRSGRGRVSAAKLEGFLEQTRQYHREHLDALLGRYGLNSDDVGVYLVKGDPAASIRVVAEQLKADLIVMGTVGRTGITGFFIGNTAEEVLQTTHASVLAVKPKGFVSPVKH